MKGGLPMAREVRRRWLLELAASKADENTVPAREHAARLLTQANAVARGVPIPAYARTEK